MSEQSLVDDILPYLEAIVDATNPRWGRNPNRSRALAGQIARCAIEELRRPRLVEKLESEDHG